MAIILNRFVNYRTIFGKAILDHDDFIWMKNKINRQNMDLKIVEDTVTENVNNKNQKEIEELKNQLKIANDIITELSSIDEHKEVEEYYRVYYYHVWGSRYNCRLEGVYTDPKEAEIARVDIEDEMYSAWIETGERKMFEDNVKGKGWE